MGHIVPHLPIVLLIGIHVLCKAGCKVLFTKTHCNIIYKNKVILHGYTDPSTDLWTLPINTTGDQIQSKGKVDIPHKNSPATDHINHLNLVTFVHSIQTRANSVMFAHQLLCNPTISTLLKATRHGFLCGRPNINEKLILKYPKPSPATAKGHMKRPRHGIQSTTPKPTKSSARTNPKHQATYLAPFAEIVEDPYSKKTPLPRIGCLAVSPNTSSYQVLGQSQIIHRHITHSNHPRIHAQ